LWEELALIPFWEELALIPFWEENGTYPFVGRAWRLSLCGKSMTLLFLCDAYPFV
jgi:hypothetical protein